MAGTIEISSESLTGVSRFLRKRMSSSLAKMLTKRRTCPLSSQMRSLMPGYWVSRLAMRAPTVPPVAVTSSLPCVSFRSGVGIRMVAICVSPLGPGLLELVKIAEARADQLRLGQLAHQRVLRLHAVARDADDHRAVVLSDAALLDEADGRAQRDAAAVSAKIPSVSARRRIAATISSS